MLLGAAVLGGRLLRRIGALRPACRAGMKAWFACLACLVHVHIPMLLVSWCVWVNPSVS